MTLRRFLPLKQKISDLQQKLAEAQQELSQAQQTSSIGEKEKKDSILESISYNGTLRANYVFGDYDTGSKGPSRGGHGGNFSFEIFKIDLGLNYGNWIGALQYRWYDGYNMLHTGWVGYKLNDESEVKVGVQRVPFGPGAWGISQSWFFDQHYYVGLADDMDTGITYRHVNDSFELDVGYFIADEGNWRGQTDHSARYSYDVVPWQSSVDAAGNISSSETNGYEEQNQFNIRFIKHLKVGSVPTQLGGSVQYGELDGLDDVDDGKHWAASLHVVNQLGNTKLASQLTRYEIDISDDNAWGTDTFVPMGAFDFAWPVATEAWIAGVSLSHNIATPSIDWLDSVTPFVEYSTIVKDEDNFNDSELFTAGAAWASGGWYIYSEVGLSNGNFFVGNEGDNYSNVYSGVGDFGANGNDDWVYRFNLNLGYYF